MEQKEKSASALEKFSARYGYLFIILVFAISVGLLYWLGHYNYLLFHSLAEIYSIVIAFAIFAIAWNARRFMDNNYLLFIGIAFLFIGILDTLHTLSYKGMGVFPGYDANLPTQFWISGRYLQAFSFLVALFFIRRRVLATPVFLTFSLIFGLILALIFYWKVFPVCYVEGTGLTPFKIISEYIISLVLLASTGLLIYQKKEFGGSVVKLLVAAMLTAVASEMVFTLYTDVYGITNVIGHLLKILSFYLIYKAFIVTGLTQPYILLFHNLKKSEISLGRQAEELRLVNDKLRQEIIEREKTEKELEQRTTELEAINRELEAFSYSVSHDLRAPLRSLDGFSQAILEDYADKLDETGRDYLTRIQNASQSMARLIDELLKLSRVTRLEMHMEDVNLSEIAGRIVRELAETQPQRQVEFVIAPGITARGDSQLLQILLRNLLENAWKFTSKNPLTRIEFGYKVYNEEKVYYIKDNGVGFDMKYASRLFQPFQRLHRESDFSGTGIGLATAQRIVHRHGGHIWAEAEIGKGATFYFTIGNW